MPCGKLPPVETPANPPAVRLAELVAALSLGIDLGFGQPMEHVLGQCLIALRLAERLGLEEQQRAAVYYSSLLINVGCHSDAYEQAKWFGDDIALRSDKYVYGLRSFRGAVAGMRRIGAGHPPARRARIAFDFALSGHREIDGMIAQHARLAQTFAAQLGLPAAVLDALSASYEHWDGRGWPGALAGEAIPVASRIAQLAEFIEVAHRGGGVAGALAVAERGCGREFDPGMVDCLRTDPRSILDGPATGTWDAVIAAEPGLAVFLAGPEFDAALEAVADFVDLKSPFMLGHSRAVAELASAAAARSGLAESDVHVVYRAALVSSFGRLSVSNAIWDKPGRLGAGEWERIRMYPYVTERMLRQSPALSPLGRIASAHRERMDGSGYPRGLSGSALTVHARLVGAAEAYQTKREPRPHRRPLSDARAAEWLRAEVRAGRLDAGAVEAVLAAAGHPVSRRRDGPAGLTAREIEVLKLAARGLSNRQIAERLVISPKTVGNHIEHIYTKVGASNRATASLFAVQHGLLPEGALPRRHAKDGAIAS
ncbi:MAG: LuxR family transcriptional regulator [Dehalococcoidia bacterium]|nr:LuxR family transcriptional regulator [Dehalococcoidia bacterium]